MVVVRSVPLRMAAFRGSSDEPPRACGVSSVQESSTLRCTALCGDNGGTVGF
ncbi:hypothetical protein [Rossellomorea marisflavi]|uniref:hypothetical protein n=1 Tax=Rossellomorea marisflavi TaxID=189381 RepID=UPI00345DE87E